jgi:hypothetical protein
MRCVMGLISYCIYGAVEKSSSPVEKLRGGG